MSARCCVCGRQRTGLIGGRCPTVEECEAWARDTAAQATNRLATKVRERWDESTVACSAKASDGCLQTTRVLHPPGGLEEAAAKAKCIVCSRYLDAQRDYALERREYRASRAAPRIERAEQAQANRDMAVQDADDRERAARGLGPRAPQFVRDRFKR